jgi:hypothetical protein
VVKSTLTRLLALVLVLTAVLGCRKEPSVSDYETADAQSRGYNFIVYPGARYLAELTELVKKAHFVLVPNAKEAPQTALYDTDASLEDVANFYAKQYGYGNVAADQTGNLSSVRPPAYYRSGDLHADAVSSKPILDKLQLNVDVNKAQGRYRGANIDAQPNHPHVTLSRPYFDQTRQLTVDRTLIMLVRE